MVRVSLSCGPAVCSVLLGFDPVFRSPMVHVWHISQRIGIDDWAMWYWQYCPCKTIYIPPWAPQRCVGGILLTCHNCMWDRCWFASAHISFQHAQATDRRMQEPTMKACATAYHMWCDHLLHRLKRCSRPKLLTSYIVVYLPPGARVRPPTNYWVSYQLTIRYLTNQLLGILPTNYWVSYQPTYNIPFINFSPPLGNPCF